MQERGSVHQFLEPFSLDGKSPGTVLAAVRFLHQSPEEVERSLDELEFLCATLGLRVIARVVQRRVRPHPRTFLGPGKLREVADLMRRHRAGFLVFDGELTPAQLFHIEKELGGFTVMDRADVILHIFSKHARTAQAKLQVELARLQHLLPRLRGMWTHLERQRGGIGLRAGAGEKELEKDRRMILRRITHLRRKLEEIARQGRVRRARRQEMVRVAMVGYTNVGKTTLMNLLARETLRAENQLFVTLDTTVRRVVLDGIPFLLSDTVGFIRKLPHHLVESFKATLEEAREADILLHVVDVSHPDRKVQVQTVLRVLREIGIQNPVMIYVCNKVDRLVDSPEQIPAICQEVASDLALDGSTPMVCISATRGWNLGAFKRILLREVVRLYRERYPHVVPRLPVFRASLTDQDLEVS